MSIEFGIVVVGRKVALDVFLSAFQNKFEMEKGDRGSGRRRLSSFVSWRGQGCEHIKVDTRGEQ